MLALPWLLIRTISLKDVRVLLKAHNTAFRSRDAQAYLNEPSSSPSTATSWRLRSTSPTPTPTHVARHSGHEWLQANTSPPSSDTSFINKLNNFYTRFEKDNHETAIKIELTANHQPLSLSPIDVEAALSRINAHKAAVPDGIPEHVLRTCAWELAGVLTDLFNLSLARYSNLLQIHHHHAGTKTLHTKILQCAPTTSVQWHSPHYFQVLRAAASGTPQILPAPHPGSSPICLPKEQEYIHLFIDLSSAFNTAIPSKLVAKLTDLGIIAPICNWLLDFLTNRLQHVQPTGIRWIAWLCGARTTTCCSTHPKPESSSWTSGGMLSLIYPSTSMV